MKHQHIYKHPHTYAERKAYADAVEQGVTPRAKRSPRALPELWDDKAVSSRRFQGWTATRRPHQWKA